MRKKKEGFIQKKIIAFPGIYEIEIKPNENKKITFVCSLEENIDKVDGEKLIKKEVERLEKSNNKITKLDKQKRQKDKLLKEFIIATDNFIVYRP